MPTIAVINATPGLTSLLRDPCAAAGLRIAEALVNDLETGRLDPEAFCLQHDPKVIVYDLAPPYTHSVSVFRGFKRLPAVRDREFVVTSQHPARVQALLGREDQVQEVVNHSGDLTPLVVAITAAITAATRAGSSR